MKRLTARIGTVLVLAFTATAIIAAPASAAPPALFDCPEPNGLFLHEDPAKFWHCSNGYPYEMDCPANLHFSVTTQRCEWPVVARNPNATGIAASFRS